MSAAWPLPSVSDDLIVDFDLFNVEPVDGDLFAGWRRLHEGPSIFYTPLNGGYWVATRAEDIYEIARNNERFSNSGVALLREHHGPRFIPGELDPPVHTAFRNILNPELSPRRVKDLEDAARALSVDVITKLAPQGECEFRGAVALRMPI